MLQLLTYNSSAGLPHELASEIQAALLDQWPGPDMNDAEGPMIEPELHPTYFVLAAGGQLRSYARTIWAHVTHRGKRLKLYGLGDVITLPEYRRRGYASRVVQAATAHIQSDPEADAALLITESELGGLYRRSGWEYVRELRVESGEYEGQEASDTCAMMLFLSKAARCAREGFASSLLVLPGDEW